MKKKIIAIFMILSVCIIFCGCFEDNITIDEGYCLIRIHIRADSNEKKDQEVKLKVRDEITSYLTHKLKGITDRDKAYTTLQSCLPTLKSKADMVLKDNGFDYKSCVRLNNEFFPARMYNNVVVESGYYDALIIELGSGSGDNWWCVIYPPLCYLDGGGSGGVVYKSKIKELLDKYF